MRYVLAILAAVAALEAQSLSDVRRLYDAGNYREAIAAAEQARNDSGARSRFIEAQSHEKLNNVEEARQVYEALAGGGDPVWKDIGAAAAALLDKRTDEALAAASRASAQEGAPPEASFVLGLVQMTQRDYGDAAAAFSRVTDLDPTYAAAYYYGGLAEYRAKRVDRMARDFETFLKLAPNAPERPEVESVMRTVRGR